MGQTHEIPKKGGGKGKWKIWDLAEEDLVWFLTPSTY